MTGAQLVRRSPNGVSIAASNMDPIQLGQVLAESGFFQDSAGAAQAAVKVMAGAELGFGPVASMTGIYIVKGRVTLSANLMAAAIKAHPRYTYRVQQHTASTCVIDFIENGEVIGTSEFTMDDAKAAGLASSDNYRKFAKNMLFARALSNGAKWYCPDAFGGGPVYTPDELGAEVDGETGEVVDAKALAVEPAPAPAPTPAPDLPKAMVDELKAARFAAQMPEEWLRLQLGAIGVEDVPERITLGVIKRLTVAQANQLLDVLNQTIESKKAEPAVAAGAAGAESS